MIDKFLRRSAIFLIVASLFSLVTFFSKPQAVSAATISSSTWYTVVNQGNGKCVDNANGGTANGNVIQQWACSANNVNQQWQFVPTSSGNYEIITHNAAGMVWDIAGPSTANGALLHLWTYGGGANQQWMPVALDATHYKFVNLYSGTCLDVPAASTTDGVQLEQYTCNGTGAQSWSLNAVGGSPTATPTFVPATATSTTTTLPDLTISSVTYAPSIIACQNQPGTNVTVANIGNANAGAFVVALNGSTQTVSSLAAGQSTTLRFNIAPGNATATADSTNVITESNENNNTLTATLPIPTPAPTCTPTSGSGSPFSGTPYSIPGKVEAENYNTGGEGVAYHDSDATNSGTQYRTDGVDIEATTDTGGGFNVGWTATGEWENYTVNVTSAGTYTVDVRVAANAAGSALHLEVDGANVTGSVAIPSTGGWQTWTDVTKTGVSLSAGQHVVRLFIDAGGMNINWFSFSGGAVATNTPSGADGTPFSGSPYNIPGKVEAENYNNGGDGVAFGGTGSTTNQGGQYRTDTVSIEATTDAGGGFDVGWTVTGEWLKYTVNVPTGGTYSVDVRVASANTGSALHMEVDGANVTGSLTVPNTGGWQTWSDVIKSGFSLSAGQHVLRLFIDAGGMNINWLNIVSGTIVTPTPIPGGWAGRYFAPYIDTTTIQGSLASMLSSAGAKYVTLAFIDNGGGCSAVWPGGASMTSGFLSSDITSIRNAGGDAMPSFGGYNANELADNCPDVASVQGQYQAVINAYHFTHLDFDIEDGPNNPNLENTTANDRRNKALAALQQANPGLFITFTVPASTSGLEQNSINLLNNAVSNGVNVGAVNIMVMDYGSSGTEMGNAAISAGNGLEGQLASIFTGKSTAQLWQMVALTPMIGQNDTLGEIFTLGDASTVLSYAQSNNIREVSFWALARDNGSCPGSTGDSNTCSGISQSTYQFSSIFKAFTQ